MSKHIETKRKLKEESKSNFLMLIDDLMLSDNEQRMMILYYVKKKSMMEIADDLGYSEIGVVKMHDRILKKVAKML